MVEEKFQIRLSEISQNGQIFLFSLIHTFTMVEGDFLDLIAAINPIRGGVGKFTHPSEKLP